MLWLWTQNLCKPCNFLALIADSGFFKGCSFQKKRRFYLFLLDFRLLLLLTPFYPRKINFLDSFSFVKGNQINLYWA
jgi:hypothetical protein